MTAKGAEDRGAFGSFAELGELLQIIAARLHAKNRVWLGEARYARERAFLIDRRGRDMAPLIDDPETNAAFGAAHLPPRLDPEAQRARLIALAFPDAAHGPGR